MPRALWWPHEGGGGSYERGTPVHVFLNNKRSLSNFLILLILRLLISKEISKRLLKSFLIPQEISKHFLESFLVCVRK